MQDRLRLASGMLLAVYVLCHFLNHMLGIVSIELQQSAAKILTLPWNRTILLGVLLAALVIHPLLSMVSLQRRRHLMLPSWQRAQIWLGLLIPPLLSPHLIKALMYTHHFNVDVDYHLVQLTLWIVDLSDGVTQIALFIVTWVHGCIGVWSWAHLKPWYAKWYKSLTAFAWSFPALALAGHVSSGMQIIREVNRNPDLPAEVMLKTGFTMDMIPDVMKMEKISYWVIFAMVLATIMFPMFRHFTLRVRKRGAQLYFADRQKLRINKGATVLEVLQTARIDHPSLCGGLGRCSTCRVRVGKGSDDLQPPSPLEQKVLERIKAPDDVRLACQIRPQEDLKIWPLLTPCVDQPDVFTSIDSRHGQELVVAVLFADLRGFTAFSEKRLPFDVLFVLNRYFRFMGTAIEEEGGRLDKFIGDGIMALFGLDGDPKKGCKNALKAAKAMGRELEKLNGSLADELDEPLRIGIGIHVGNVIVGEMGHGPARQLTAIGDTVNSASRLESLTKEHGAQLVVSQDVTQRAGIDMEDFPLMELNIRGRLDPLPARVVVALNELELE
ncbi:MAG: adenylate/guanylate cyclase domain-containing protein [Magnetococcales bacterium]|nr:adenylate/guanylate cyclase domain-containing protein [Magnetococcales bacterium]